MPSAPPDDGPDHILDTLFADASRYLWESVGDVHADLFPGRELPAMLRDVRRRPAGRVLAGLLRRLIDGPLASSLDDASRRFQVDELPGALAALGLLPDDECTADEGGAA